MYASLRGASSTENSAKLNRISSWDWPPTASRSSSQYHPGRTVAAPIELPTPIADTFYAVSISIIHDARLEADLSRENLSLNLCVHDLRAPRPTTRSNHPKVRLPSEASVCLSMTLLESLNS